MEKNTMFKSIFQFIINYYYMVLIPFLSISVLFVSQYMTRGIEYFLDENGKPRWRFLGFLALLQFLISILITWSVLSAFNSDMLSEYETIKMTSMIIIGSSPFNITILVWVALKLEAYRLMKKRYGDDFQGVSIIETLETIPANKDSKKDKEASLIQDSANEQVDILPSLDSIDETKKEKINE